MESIAHSRQPNKVSTTLSKKITNGNNGGFSSKTLYDDVYGGPPKFGVTSLSPRFEDYGEIFGSFHTARASSIPVLDLPVVDEAEVLFDVRGSGFDYAEVFGGFNGLDFAVSYEHLFHQPIARGAVSSEEAWTPEEDSVSEASDYSGNNQSISNGDPYQTVDGSTEFNILYHKVNRGSNGDMSKGKTHITQLHAVPGFTLVFNETTPLYRTDPTLQVVDDINLDMDFTADKMKGSHLRKTMSHPSNHTSGEQAFGNDPKLHNGSSRTSSHSSESFITVSDISLRTRPSRVPPPSRSPPVLDGKKGDTGTFHLNSERFSSEGTQGDSSPPFFDVEVDMSSSAAASAAAMKEAMHIAEAKLRSDKELKERKKAAFESHAKLSHIVKKDNENKMNENLNRSSSLKDERLQATSDRRYSKMKIPATDESQKAMKSAPETPDLYEGERLLNVSQKTAEEKHVKKSRSSQGSDRSIEVGMWKEATEFFELVGAENPEKAFQRASHTKSSEQDMRIHEDCLNEKEASVLQEENKKVKASEENCQMEECKKKFKPAKEASEQDKNLRRSKASTEEHKQREHMRKEKFAKASDQEDHEKNTRIAHELEKIEKKVTEADQSGYLANMSETRHKEHKQMEGKKSKEVDRLIEVPQGLKLKKNDKKLNEAEKSRECAKRNKQSEKMIHNEERREASALEQAEGEAKLKESVKLEENDGKSREGFKQYKAGAKEACGRGDELRLKQAEQTLGKKQLKEAREREEIKKNLKDAFPKEVSSEDLKQAVEQEENVRTLTETFELEVNEKRQREAFELGENEKGVKEATERDQNEKKFKQVCDRYENEEWLQEVGGSKGNKVLNQALEREKNIEILKEAQRKEEIESPASESVDKDKSESTSIEGNEDGKKLKFAEPTGGIWNMETDENLPPAQSAFIYKDIEGPEKSEESLVDQENENTKKECTVNEKKSEEVIIENLVDNKKIRASKNTPGDLEHSTAQSGKVDDGVTRADGLGLGYGQTCMEKTETVVQLETDSRNQERKFAHEWGERGKNNQHLKVPLRQEESGDQTSSSHANLCDDSRKNTEAAEPATVQEAINSHKTAQRFHVGQSTDKKEKNLSETCTSEERDTERMRREKELEKDRLRKMEEEREREREREKDRIAVDRAMLEAEREREREKDRMGIDRATVEARDRAYSEARERAERAAFERATAEARQRALAEARERLEKACTEARDKSFTDKATIEARLKAERAAVERATAEARERAMERAKVERAAFESRERLERSVSDKFSASFRNGGSRQVSSSSDMQDPQFQNSKHPYSSVYGASSFSERSEGGEGESAQRYRARLERYRRTAERAAKALAEKNMRDLLAQKEQAERSRLAETLDAEVRRWSSGKEGNLRALLSTLQYILGPNSGWQPIPLTEVITSAAVKKAYRKATLCVHPDKLQQRGASIQHKYICEKVFDLLKEAWNKFNSEER